MSQADDDNDIFKRCRDIYDAANPPERLGERLSTGEKPQDVTLPAELFDAYEEAILRRYGRIPYGGIDLERGEYLLLKAVKAFRGRDGA